MTLLVPDLASVTAASVGGPAWMQSRRVDAAERARSGVLPTTDEEVWRYSRVGELELDRFHLGPSPSGSQLPEALTEVLGALPARAATLVTIDGRLVHRTVDEALVARGAVIGSLAEQPDGAELVGSPGNGADLFADLNEALAADPLVIRIPDGMVIDEPIVVVHWLEAPDQASFPHLIVDLGSDAEATVLEIEASADVSALSVPRLELRVAPSGRLRHLGVQDVGPQVWRIANHQASVDTQASLVAAQVALGGDYARTRVDCRLVGRGATGDLLALYYGAGAQMLDFRTFQEHVAPDTTSNLLFKGAVGGHSKSVYTGLIRVHPDARGTNAFQTNRNLKLGEHAWAESVPNLEIETNDVKCSHASTVGPVDADQRFYLESRGVPPEVAERLIVAGFFDEVLDQLPVAGLAPELRRRLVARYESEDAVEVVR